MLDENKPLIKHLQVPNWNRHQHYNKRNPPWIKIYNNLLSDYEFNILPDVTKCHIQLIWLLASKTDNKITNNAAWIKMQIHCHEEIDLDAIIAAGFLEPYDGLQGLKQGRSQNVPRT